MLADATKGEKWSKGGGDQVRLPDADMGDFRIEVQVYLLFQIAADMEFVNDTERELMRLGVDEYR